MPPERALARRHRPQDNPPHLVRQCYGKRAHPSKKVATAIAAKLGGMRAYKCANCGAYHLGHTAAARDRARGDAPRLTASPGQGAWTAQRLLQAVAVFVHHYGHEPTRIHPQSDGRLAFW